MSRTLQAESFAYPSTLDTVKLLSQRDLAERVPINFVPIPGISISAACSDNNTYAGGPLSKCVQNLLVTGFRRLVLDLYWDDTRDVWSFCPVQLGTSGNASVQTSATSVASSTSSSSSTAISSATLAVREPADATIQARQASINDTSTAHSTPVSTSAATITASSTTSALISIPSSIQNDPLIHVGSYSCTLSADISLFMSSLAAYLDTTENNLNATTVYLTLNIHAVGVMNGYTWTPVLPTALPRGNQLLSSLLMTNASAYIYSPAELIQERANVNASGSWFGDLSTVTPDAAYFTLENYGGTTISRNGWPSASFVQYDGGKRLLAAFGTIDDEMKQYNTSADSYTIFQSRYIDQPRTFQASASGSLTSGCFYNPSTTSLSSVNNSWAIGNIDLTTSEVAISDFTSLAACGIAPVLNTPITNITADLSTQLYHQLVMGTIWSWNIDEPRDNANSSQNFHCAALNSTSGFWQVESCSARHYCACHASSQPYSWQISGNALSYDRVDQACPSDTDFSVSRTALENDYLLAAWRQQRTASNINDELLFLNFNDLDLSDCWVIGQDTACPYRDNEGSTNKLVVVPTVAAIIVFVLAILTVFVKCAANRQSTRQRRRRGNDDKMGDYEGVPA